MLRFRDKWLGTAVPYLPDLVVSLIPVFDSSLIQPCKKIAVIKTKVIALLISSLLLKLVIWM